MYETNVSKKTPGLTSICNKLKVMLDNRNSQRSPLRESQDFVKFVKNKKMVLPTMISIAQISNRNKLEFVLRFWKNLCNMKKNSPH